MTGTTSFCPRCGSLAEAGADFCVRCGAALKPAVATPAGGGAAPGRASPAPASPPAAGPARTSAPTPTPDIVDTTIASLRRLPGIVVVGGLAAVLVAFAIVGMAVAGGGNPGNNGGNHGTPGAGGSGSGGAVADSEYLSIGVPDGYTASVTQPGEIHLSRTGTTADTVVVAVFDVAQQGGTTLDDQVARQRNGAKNLCVDDAFAMPGVDEPAHRLIDCGLAPAALTDVAVGSVRVVFVALAAPDRDSVIALANSLYATMRIKVPLSGSGAGATPAPGAQVVDDALFSITIPAGGQLLQQSPGSATIGIPSPHGVVVVSAQGAALTAEEYRERIRAGGGALVCGDEDRALLGPISSGFRVKVCDPDVPSVADVAVGGGYLVIVQAKADKADEAVTLIDDAYAWIRWKIGPFDATTGAAGGTGNGSGTGAGGSSYCSTLSDATWSATQLVGRGVDLDGVKIPNTFVDVFPGSRVALVTLLGDAAGYATRDEADLVAKGALPDLDAAKRRAVLLLHGGRYFVFEGRAITGDDIAGAPCKLQDADGTVALWRARRFVTSPTLTESGWVAYVWWPEGSDICGDGTIHQFYPGIRQC